MWFGHQEIPDTDTENNGMWVIHSFACIKMNFLVSHKVKQRQKSPKHQLFSAEIRSFLLIVVFDVISYIFIFHLLKWALYCGESTLFFISSWYFSSWLKIMKIHKKKPDLSSSPTSHASKPKEKKTSAVRFTANYKEPMENQDLWVMRMLVIIWIYQVITGYAMAHMLKSSNSQMGSAQIQRAIEGHSKSL